MASGWKYSTLILVVGALGLSGGLVMADQETPGPVIAVPADAPPDETPAEVIAADPIGEQIAAAPRVRPRIAEAVAVPAGPAAPAEPGVEKEPPKPPPPLPRSRAAVAVIQVLDKVTAETLRFETPVGGAVRFRSLTFEVKACETTAKDEQFDDSAAYMVITSLPLGVRTSIAPAPRVVFKGWAFASSPGVNNMEHPIYDAWLISCSAAAPSPAVHS
jgi:hypothetical protein